MAPDHFAGGEPLTVMTSAKYEGYAAHKQQSAGEQGKKIRRKALVLPLNWHMTSDLVQRGGFEPPTSCLDFIWSRSK
jgi:hypothetical protein